MGVQSTDNKKTKRKKASRRAKGSSGRGKGAYKGFNTKYTAKLGYGIQPSIAGVLKADFEIYNSTGSYTNGVFKSRANSLYDPDYNNNATNDQALYYDMYKLLYNKYYVSKVSGYVDIMSPTDYGFFDMKVCVFASCDDFTASTLIPDKLFSLPGNQVQVIKGSDKPHRIKFSFTTDRITGRKNSMEDESNCAEVNNNPANCWFVYVVISALDDTQNVWFYMRGTTWTTYKMWDRKRIADIND